VCTAEWIHGEVCLRLSIFARISAALFTEFKDTLGVSRNPTKVVGLPSGIYPWRYEAGLARRAGKPDSFAEPTSYRDGEIQVLVATRSRGRGINLQVCNILFNYDIPWNSEPARAADGKNPPLRAAERTASSVNFVATNTILRVAFVQRLLEKLQESATPLDDDAVFTWWAEVLPPLTLSACCVITTRDASATLISKSGCCAM